MIADPTHIAPIPGFGEPVSALTHLLAAGVFAVLAVDLVKAGRGHTWRVFTLVIHAFAVVFQLVMSGTYHLLSPGSGGNAVLLRLDHAAIFFLIAATFTPVHGILFRGVARWGVLVFVWAAAITGIVLKTIYSSHVPIAFGASLYVGLGWVGILTGVLIWREHGYRATAPLLYGGLAYTVGLLAEWWMAKAASTPIQILPWIFGGHEFFHLAVIAGMAIHWHFIRGIAAGKLESPAAVATSRR